MTVEPAIFWTAFTACIATAVFLGKLVADVSNLKSRFDRIEAVIYKIED